MDITVRRVRRDDGALLASVRLRALADAPYAFRTTHEEASERTPEDWTAMAGRCADGDTDATFFAVSDGTVVGMAGGFVGDDPGVATLVAMWVTPAARGNGAARALIGAVSAWAAGGGSAEVQLSVLDGNDAARRLYESEGFRAVATVGGETRMARPM